MKFVIATGSFDERSGGILVLHLLCQRLTEAGEDASLWPMDRPRWQFWRNPRRYIGWLGYHITRRQGRFNKGPFANRLARGRDLADAVVIYPEVVTGNPLCARAVVRWLLHKPGFHSGRIGFGADDLLFFFQKAFYEPALGDYGDNRLALTWWNEVYRLTNHGERNGSCYLIKKGHGRPIVHDLKDSVLIDTMTAAEKADIFNKTKYFYCYDPYTLYARYAALCGCIPIIIPEPGMSRDQWVPYEEERYGVAYGEEEIDWAIATRDRLLRQIELDQDVEATILRRFIDACYAKFDPVSRRSE